MRKNPKKYNLVLYFELELIINWIILSNEDF